MVLATTAWRVARADSGEVVSLQYQGDDVITHKTAFLSGLGKAKLLSYLERLAELGNLLDISVTQMMLYVAGTEESLDLLNQVIGESAG